MTDKKLRPLLDTIDDEDPLAPHGKESKRALQALHDYAYMRYHRNLRGLVKKYKEDKANGGHPPTESFTSVSQWSVQWRWGDRVSAFDEIERKLSEAEFLEKQAKWRDNRKEVLTMAFAKVVKALQNVDTSKTKISDVTAALRTINQELRIEYKDETREGQDGSITISTAVPTVIKIIRPDELEDNG